MKLKDGTKVKLEEGKMVTLDGKVMDTPPEVASTVSSASSSTSGGSTQLPSTQ